MTNRSIDKRHYIRDIALSALRIQLIGCINPNVRHLPYLRLENPILQQRL